MNDLWRSIGIIKWQAYSSVDEQLVRGDSGDERHIKSLRGGMDVRIIVNINVCTNFELLKSQSTPYISRHGGLLGTKGRTLIFF